MVKIKHLMLLLVCMATALTACKKNTVTDNFDPVAQFSIDTTAIRAFIIAKNIPAIKDPKSGVFYQIINPGAGTVNYSGSTTVSVNYTGSLLDGTIFNNTNGTPVIFTLGGVIAGWQIGIPFIQPGGRIRLIIPSGLAYGNAANTPFPPNSILDFTVDVISAQ